ncbi:MAG: hypothetical protein E7542_02105 [Ruminococcaceae bacterium]|nr:hypothetical protein [Oscillospiraceae bacterium]
MKKKTIAIVSISLVLALLAISVIATFPTYLFEDNGTDGTSSIQSGNITESVQGDDVGELGGNGAEGVLPEVEDNNNTSTKGYIDYATTDGATVKGESGAFPKETEVEIDELGIFDKKYYRARHYVRDFADDYVMYNVTAEKDGESVIPQGIVKVIFTIPDDFDADELEVYFLLSNGVQKLNYTVDKTTKTVTVTLTQPGVFILIDKDTTIKDSDNTSSDTNSTDSSTPSDTSSNSSNTSSDNSSDSSTPDSSDTESEDPNKETMDGWTPWY